MRDEEIVGVLTSTDLLRHSAQGPLAVLRRYERLASREALPGYARNVTEMSSALLAAGLDAQVIAGFVAQLDETLLRRLLHLAEADLGPPPAPYAWLVSGAAGRREQTVPGPQDHALAYRDDAEGARGWFESLADRVGADLAAAGFPASAPERTARWRMGPLSWWVSEIERAVDERPWETPPLLDLRRSGGTLEVTAIDDALARASERRLFVRALAKQALVVEPPHLLLLRLRGTSSRVDVERRGLGPIVSLARCFAVEAGSRARNTLERLDDARSAGILAEGTHAAVTEAFRFLLGLALSVKLRAIASMRPPADEVPLSELTGIERTRLKDAFRAIRRWQESASYRYQPDLVMTGPGPR
jgi:CBS domain-containing protein